MSRRRGRNGKGRSQNHHQQSSSQAPQRAQGNMNGSDQRGGHRHAHGSSSSKEQKHQDGSQSSRGANDRGTQPKYNFQSAVQPRRTLNRPPTELAVAPKTPTKRFQVVFFDTLNQAKSDLPNLRQLASNCDHLNIVVRAEGPMDDPELINIGKLFCGAAWSLIHERRKQEGWYDRLQE